MHATVSPCARLATENTGLGPAVFKKARLYKAGVDTALYETKEEGAVLDIYRADSFVRQMRNLFPEMGRFTGGMQQGIMMKAGEKQPFLNVGIPASAVPDTLSEDSRQHLIDLIEQ